MAETPSLVRSWLAVATSSGEPDSVALTQLNEALGTSYRINRLYEWRAGSRAVPQPVQDYMLRCCIEWAVWREGGVPPFDDAALDRLAARLCPPGRS